MTWTDDRVEQLKLLFNQGHPARVIAYRLGGVTRNAVIGKLARLGLSIPRPPGQISAKRNGKDNNPFGRNGVKGALERRAARVKAAGRDDHLPIDKSSFACTLLELTADTCRWPLGDPATAEFRFCGAPPATGLPYCARHCALAYTAAHERRERHGRISARSLDGEMRTFREAAE